MKRGTMSVREQCGSQRWQKSRNFAEWGTGLRRASQVLFERFCRQQS